jgi:hypothetical protein
MDTYESQKYNTDKEHLNETLNMYGVAVIPSVFSYQECDDLLNKMWTFFEHITQNFEQPIDRINQDSFKQLFKLYPLHAMLIQRFGIGHAQFAWDARQNPKAVEIFAHFWKCKPEELLVSFDGSSFHLPPEITKRGWNLNNTWYHADQSYTRNNFECVQSFVTYNPINVGDGTLAFMEGSNRFHKKVSEKFELSDKADWYKINKDIEEYYLSVGCEYKKISCPKGSIVFWDSRTIHCGVEPFKGREEPNIRAITYLCYMPGKSISDANRRKKIKALQELRTTNHWSCKPKLFSVNPRTYGKELPNVHSIDPPVLTKLGKQLAGYIYTEHISDEEIDSSL